LARAQKAGIIKINAVNLRDFTTDNHKTVDDTPYGGGAGMVMKAEPIYKALNSLGALSRKASGLNKVLDIFKKITNNKLQITNKFQNPKSKITILLSPRGKQFNQRMAEDFSKYKEISFVCGRYEGVDQRVSDYMVDEEISVGPYVLAGGELAALVMMESISRLIPGVLGNEESLREETFGSNFQFPISNFQTNSKSQNQNEYPQYTKPENFNGWKVPEVLLSGNHEEIKKWRCNPSPGRGGVPTSQSGR
jgi:tRNA (guanine37-N1)-methyltransferase